MYILTEIANDKLCMKQKYLGLYYLDSLKKFYPTNLIFAQIPN